MQHRHFTLKASPTPTHRVTFNFSHYYYPCRRAVLDPVSGSVSVLHRSRVHFDACCYLLVFNGGWCFILQPHQDGPSYFPVVAILSLGSPVVMDFTPHAKLKLDSQEVTDKESDGETFEIGKDKWLDDHRPFSVILMPRSLLIFKDEAYSGYFSLVL